MSQPARLLVVLILMILTACGSPDGTAGPSVDPTQSRGDNGSSNAALTLSSRAGTTLRLATTTSTADSGLLDAILPDFEQRYNANVEYIGVGTGQALKLGENGDADVVLVHARKQEDAFVAQGFGVNRRAVMYNDFVVVGPVNDPAKIKGLDTAQQAFERIAKDGASFASRGDNSGTHTKEQAVWATTGITPTAELSWYKSLGQGMSETLMFANEQGAYTLTDRGTYLSMRDKLPDLSVKVGGETIDQNTDTSLRNPYGVIQVNPARHSSINADLAASFVEWITSAETQQRIGEFGRDTYNQPLFYPAADR
jgi:tungstate transport system substrate-binding protein